MSMYICLKSLNKQAEVWSSLGNRNKKCELIKQRKRNGDEDYKEGKEIAKGNEKKKEDVKEKSPIEVVDTWFCTFIIIFIFL